MKKIIIIAIVLTTELFASQVMQAQGNLYLSNLGETSSGSAAVASDAWLAEVFKTGTNPSGYVLNSVQLFMDAASGSPSGFSVSIYSSAYRGYQIVENGNTNTTTVTVGVVSQPPVATNFKITVGPDPPWTIVTNALAQAYSPNDYPLSVISVGPATYGLALINPDNTIAYT